jgi:hypothetical protein
MVWFLSTLFLIDLPFHLRLDVRAEFLARPELFSARPELGSAREENGPSRAQNFGPQRVFGLASSARAGPKARYVFFQIN